MQTELTNAKQNAKVENKICKLKSKKMICKTKTKQDNLLEGKDGQDDAHVGATSPSLGVSTSW